MTDGNPLVAAAAAPAVDPWAGVWIAEDIQAIAAGVTGGSWVDTSLGAVSAGLDALAFVADPVGSLLQYGVAWIIEHVRPLSEALEWLAGDPAQIAAHAQTWRNVAGSLQDRAADLARRAHWDTESWTGAAADAYRTWNQQQKGAIEGLAAGADCMAVTTESAGVLIAGVRLMVRDAIAVVVSRLITYAAEVVATAGLATPVVLGQVGTLCAAWAARISRWLKASSPSSPSTSDHMAIEYDWYGDAEIELATLREHIADAIQGEQHPDGTVFAPGIYVMARPPDDDYDAGGLFGFTERFSATFRFANLADEETTNRNAALMAHTLIGFAQRYPSRGILLFNGDTLVLQYGDDGVVFDAAWEAWAENPETAPLLAQFPSRVLPQPLK